MVMEADLSTLAAEPCGTDVETCVDPEYEALRQHALEELGLLDTPQSESFDRITRIASRLFGAPVAAISLTDRSRQWFKSHIGTLHREIPRSAAPCAEVTRSQQFLNVPDMLKDERFCDSPLAAAGTRFYAGAPLTTRSGYTLGAMCVLDSEPRIFTPEQEEALKDFAAMVMSQIELQHEAGRIDVTSGLPNRHQLYDDIEEKGRRHPGREHVLLVVELADLRHVNDAVSILGAAYLDGLLKSSAKMIRKALSQKAMIYQIGFASVALLLDRKDVFIAEEVEMITRNLKLPTLTNGVPVIINAVVGASSFQLGELSPQDALRRGVSAARQARQTEIEYADFDSQHDEAHRRRFDLISSVDEALKKDGQFSLVYQPRLDLKTGVYTSAEALLRWTHPELGNVCPGEFVPLIEQTALIRPVTRWVLSRACLQLQQWRQQKIGWGVSVNISARNLEEPDFADVVAQAMGDAGIMPSDLELEFTESALIRFQSRVLAQLHALREMGIGLAIDDFGTGYSSFSYLRHLPASVVKLDQSFMRELAQNDKDQSMVRSMIAMAQDVGYRVVAEGVETEEVFNLLRSYGCDEVQGFLLSRPLSPSALKRFVSR